MARPLEKRRDYFAELYRSGRWRIYYDDEDALVAQVREVAAICDRWTTALEQHRQALSELVPPTIDREAA
jgi:hypothetical protein